MAATIKIKNSSTTGAVPTSGDLVQGELAVNVTDTGLYTENASGTVVKLNAPSIDDKNTGATKHLTISTGGNLGLGVTPSSWASGTKGLEVGQLGNAIYGFSATNLFATQNAYYNGTNWIFASSNRASYYQQNSGLHTWATSTASGTAGGTVTWTAAMTLDASGRLGIGTTSPGDKITIAAGASTGAAMTFWANGVTSSSELYIGQGGSNEAYVFNRANSYLVFGTNNNERARIDSSGRLLVGLTSSQGGIVQSQSTTAGTQCYLSWNSATSGTRYFHYFVTGAGATAVGSITTDGTTTTYATSSDYRLKEISGSLTGYKERLSALQPKQGKWKENGAEFRGFLAHEFATSYPSSVNGEKDAVDENGNPKYQGMQAGSSEVIADLVAYIKELETRLSALEQA